MDNTSKFGSLQLSFISSFIPHQQLFGFLFLSLFQPLIPLLRKKGFHPAVGKEKTLLIEAKPTSVISPPRRKLVFSYRPDDILGALKKK
ncbi:hypothetical protein RIF29_29751 [Crotalaria pallida]|uniref:Uncharacterized protein n=1 Tax=Crotalaria pallida TaxID=3830 RepID=A0AAN9EH84_CROPI